MLQHLSPAQEVTRIVRDELIALLGGRSADVDLSGRPAVIALVGLQGSGKTTSAGKLALNLKIARAVSAARRRRPRTAGRRLAAADARPADRNSRLRSGRPHRSRRGRPRRTRRGAADRTGHGHRGHGRPPASRRGPDARGAARSSTPSTPSEILFVADAMTGQDAVRSAAGFAAALPLTGIILTKTDGDARGGAALTVVSTLDKPIKFVGVGEKPEDFEAFHPDRMASRILGLGDVLTLIEKVEAPGRRGRGTPPGGTLGRRRVHARRPARPARVDEEDGPALRAASTCCPRAARFEALSPRHRGREGARARVGDHRLDDREERRYPQILNGCRKKRIAGGSGTSVAGDQPAAQAVPADAASS